MSNQADWANRNPIVRADIATQFYQWFNNQQGTPTYAPIKGATKTDAQLDAWFSAFADTCIAAAKRANAQGVFIADSNLENGYDLVGDPRETNKFFPTARIVTFCNKIKAAGYRIGFCVRPGIRVSGIPGIATRVKASEWVMGDLFQKIDYAIKTFGASIFYVDSNTEDDFPLDPRTIVNLRAFYSYTQVLISFEHWVSPPDARGWSTPDYFSNGCAYWTPTQTLPPCAAPFPGAPTTAFCFIHPLDPTAWNEALRPQWVAAAAWGNIFLVEAWPGSTHIDRVNEVRAAASALNATPPASGTVPAPAGG